MKTVRYFIMVTDNSGSRRTHKEFKTLTEAKQYIKKLNAPGKSRTFMVNGKKKTIRLTSFRGGISGTGINNPRIKKAMVNR